MTTIKPIKLNLAERLQNRRFRERFISTGARDQIAAQIRQLRIQRGYATQMEFAKVARMQQSAVSRIEKSEYSGWTFRTLLRVAFALRARLRVTFEPIEDTIEVARRREQAATDQQMTDTDDVWLPQSSSEDRTPVEVVMTEVWSKPVGQVQHDLARVN
jgi:transcriptional regulator with XRE-family HTH domain